MTKIPFLPTKPATFWLAAGLGLALLPLAHRAPEKAVSAACYEPRSVLTSADIQYLGAIRMPLSGVDTTYAGGGMTGRIVNGTVHFFLYGTNAGANGNWQVHIQSASSSSVFTIDAGQGAQFQPGQTVYVVRKAANGAIPDWRTIQSISGDQITLTAPLGAMPQSGDGFVRDGDGVYEIVDPGGGYSLDYTTAPRATLATNWSDVYQGHRVSWDSNTGQLLAPIGQLTPGDLYWSDANHLLYWTYFNAYNVAGNQDWGLGATSLNDPATGAATAVGPWRAKATNGDGSVFYGPWRCLYLLSNPADGSMMCGSTLQSGDSMSPFGPDLYGGSPWPTAATPAGHSAADLAQSSRYLEYYYMNPTSANHFNADGSVSGTLRTFRRRTEPYVWELPALIGQTTPTNADPLKNGGVGSWTERDSTGGCIWLELTQKHGFVCAATLVGSTNQDPTDCVNAAHEWYSNAGVNPPNGACSHGCLPPTATTGPVTTAAFPAFIVFNPDDVNAVKSGARTDYSVEAASVIDLGLTYGMHTASISTMGSARVIRGFYFDPIRKYLFTLAPQADDSRSGPIFKEALIQVFAIHDGSGS